MGGVAANCCPAVLEEKEYFDDDEDSPCFFSLLFSNLTTPSPFVVALIAVRWMDCKHSRINEYLN